MGTEELVWIVAVIFSLIGVGSLLHMAYIRSAWPRAVGCVVGNFSEWSKSSANPRHSVYFARISFVAHDGKTYEVKGDVGRRVPWPDGERIDLWYKSNNPKHTLCMKLWQQLTFSGMFIAIGVVCWAKTAGLVR